MVFREEAENPTAVGTFRITVIVVAAGTFIQGNKHDRIYSLYRWGVSVVFCYSLAGTWLDYRYFYLCRVAGATSAFATCPLEVLKTRLQSTVGQAMVYQVLPLSGGTAAVEATVPSLIFQRYAVLGQYAR